MITFLCLKEDRLYPTFWYLTLVFLIFPVTLAAKSGALRYSRSDVTYPYFPFKVNS